MDLSPVERAVLTDLLINGDDKPSNIAQRTGYTRPAVSRRCPPLVERGLLSDKGGGVYTLTNAGVQVAQNLSQD